MLDHYRLSTGPDQCGGNDGKCPLPPIVDAGRRLRVELDTDGDAVFDGVAIETTVDVALCEYHARQWDEMMRELGAAVARRNQGNAGG